MKQVKAQKYHKAIDEAKTLDELKAVIHNLVDDYSSFSEAVEAEVFKGKLGVTEANKLIDRINEYRKVIQEANTIEFQAMRRLYLEGEVGKEDLTHFHLSDKLDNLKYIRNTRKIWTCCLCNKTLPLGVEVFRSSERLNRSGTHFKNRYYCVPCMVSVKESLYSQLDYASNVIAEHGIHGIQ